MNAGYKKIKEKAKFGLKDVLSLISLGGRLFMMKEIN